MSASNPLLLEDIGPMPPRPPFRGEGTFDPWKCYYGSLEGCSICGYCRGDVTDAATQSSIGPRNRRDCGHAKSNQLCTCRKVREPITEREAFLLLARSL